MTVGQRIKARRKQLGMNAETLAKKLNVSPSTIYRYESGAIEKVDSAIIEPIADALLTTPSYLMGWDDDGQESTANETPSDAPKTPEARIVSGGMDKLPKEQREQILAVVRAMFINNPDIFKD